MKKALWMHVVGLSLAIAIAACSIFPTYWQREKRYYSKSENYITVTGKVTQIKYLNNDKILISVESKSVNFTDTGFVIRGDSAKIARENSVETKLTVGSSIEFICAPRYFGDGYKIPIVALYINEETILDFETGFDNLNAEYCIFG